MTKSIGLAASVFLLAATALAGSGAAIVQPAVTWLIFVDDLHLDFRNTGRLRTLVRTIVKELPIDGESVAMFASGPSRVSVVPTTDRTLLDNEVGKLTGNGLRPADITAAPGDRELRYRATVAQTRVGDLLASATAAGGLRTALVYISNGYGGGPPPVLPVGSSATVFALDPRLWVDSTLDRMTWPAHWAATRESLRALAAPSGGFALEDGHSLADALARIAAMMRQ